MEKILIVLTRYPFPTKDGTRKRIADTVLAGLKQEYRMDLLMITDEEKPAEFDAYAKEMFGRVHVYRRPRMKSAVNAFMGVLAGRPLQVGYYTHYSAMKWLRANYSSYKAFYLHTLRLGWIIESFERIRSKCFLDLNDAISLNYKDAMRFARFPWNVIYAVEKNRVARYESKLLNLVKNIGAVSKYDIDYLKLMSKEPDKVFWHIPQGEDIAAVPFKSPCKRLIFLGNLKYPPNADAIGFFLKNIFPELRRRIPECSISVAGADSENLPKQSGVEGLGYVNDIVGFFSSSALFVAPIRFGAGVPSKILTSLSYGIPVITSPIGARGLEDALSGPTVCNVEIGEWVDTIIQILGDEERRRALSIRSIEYIRKYYSSEHSKAEVRRAMGSL